MNERLLRILGGEKKFYPHGLEEKYPRIFEKIMFLWDKPGMSDYFAELMMPVRQDRVGFPPEIASEIVRLSLVHFTSHAPDKSNDVWEVSTEKFASFKPSVNIENAKAWKPPPLSTAQAIGKLGFPCTARGFHRAAETGDRRAVALFLEARVNTEIADERGWTPMMLAANKGYDEVIGVLFKHQANVNARDVLSNTALHWAADAGQLSSAKLLIVNHAEVDACNQSGVTPLALAATRRHLGIVLLLIDAGANLDLSARDGSTALHQAAAAGYTEIVRTLLFHGTDKCIKNFDGDTPLSLAEKNNQTAVIKLLISGVTSDNTEQK